jgi:signal transduction histidine kinase
VVSLDELNLEIEELRASRARVVAGADATRRRIERVLHDGAQQHLVALAVKLQLARQLFESDPEAGLELLDEIRRDVHDALDGVRELAQAIYPPLLLDRGLGDALAAAAASAAVQTRVETAMVDRYAPEIEATAYFCCVEALTRVPSDAAAAATAALRAWSEKGQLCFEILLETRDADGDACLSEATVDSLRDRLGAVDGELRIGSEPGVGSRIVGTIPLER